MLLFDVAAKPRAKKKQPTTSVALLGRGATALLATTYSALIIARRLCRVQGTPLAYLASTWASSCDLSGRALEVQLRTAKLKA